jgi:hypothetical protein
VSVILRVVQVLHERGFWAERWMGPSTQRALSYYISA